MARHRIEATDVDAGVMERALIGWARVLAATSGYRVPDETKMEADRLAHITAVVQGHSHDQCDCPSEGEPS